MKQATLMLGTVLLLSLLSVRGQDEVPPKTIARTWGGQFMEVVIQKQQQARKDSRTPTYLDVGDPVVIEDWVEGVTIPPGSDGRISTFRPPLQIVVAGFIYQLGEAMGEPTRSTGRQTTKYSTVTDQPAVGVAPEGYRWTGAIRVSTRSELVTWRRDWRYVRLRPVDAAE